MLVDRQPDAVDDEVGEHRHDRQGADERCQQRERDGQRERQEELGHEAADEAERQEDRDCRQGRRGDGAGDLARSPGDGRQPILAERPMAIDVLEDDDRVIDHASHGDREAAQGHDVQADAGQLHHDERGQDRQRDADRGDERRPQAEQEQEDRDDREEGAEAAFAEQALLGLLDERREVLDHRNGQRVGVPGPGLLE